MLNNFRIYFIQQRRNFLKLSALFFFALFILAESAFAHSKVVFNNRFSVNSRASFNKAASYFQNPPPPNSTFNFLSSDHCQKKQTELSCDFYSECLERKFHCGQDGYALGYGEHYCQEALDLTDRLSDKGQNWRNKALLCLQNSLVPVESQASYRNRCDRLMTAAFDSHPKCYTQEGASICDLSLTDWKSIFSIFKTREYADTKMWKQIFSVANICRHQVLSQIEKKRWLEIQVDPNLNPTQDLNSESMELLKAKLEFLEQLAKP